MLQNRIRLISFRIYKEVQEITELLSKRSAAIVRHSGTSFLEPHLLLRLLIRSWIQIFNGSDTTKLLDDLQLNLLGTLPMNAGLGNVSVGVYKDGDEEVEGLFNPIVINLLNSLKEIEAKKTQA